MTGIHLNQNVKQFHKTRMSSCKCIYNRSESGKSRVNSLCQNSSTLFQFLFLIFVFLFLFFCTCCTDLLILLLTDGREWFPISFHKSRPVKNPTAKKVKMPVYLMLKANGQLC